MQELIINLISGAAGGNAVGGLLKKINMGLILNTITGLIGGFGGGKLIEMLNSSGGDSNTMITQILSGIGGGGILTAIVGFIKNKMAKK